MWIILLTHLKQVLHSMQNIVSLIKKYHPTLETLALKLGRRVNVVGKFQWLHHIIFLLSGISLWFSSNMDGAKVTALTLLILSAAFDTIHHTILLRRLDDWFGVTGKALNWLKLYLTGRCQGIKLGECLSSKADLKFGVPQGSVLRPLLSCSIPLHWAAWSLNMLSRTISMPMTASCMLPLHQRTLQQHWMVYSNVWPMSSHGCRRINWNRTQIKPNSSLLGMNDSGANTSLCFRLSFSVLRLTPLKLLRILG